jgi:hypothetical protein
LSKSNPEITKWHFVGCVDYAQHNFARLKPLLYSETGRRWDGMADRAWFPNEGLVFTVQADLRYAPHGSLWIFRAGKNPRANAVDKDLISALQLKPAIELVVGMEPLPIEDLRRLVEVEGVAGVHAGHTAAAVPELNDRWVVLNDLQKDDQGRLRPAAASNLKHLKVMIGTPEELCGLATPNGQFVLPPIPGTSGETRNWLPPSQFLETLASDLKRWAPHGALKAKAQAAAQALRELSPHLAGLVALKADDAKVALARATNLVDAADTITGAAETILGLIAEQAPFKAEIERQRAEINAELEAEALAAVEQKEGAARDRLLAEQASIRSEIVGASARLEALRTELRALETEVDSVRSARAENVDDLEARVDALLQRAASEPAHLLAEWLGVSGFVISGMGSGDPNGPPPKHETATEQHQSEVSVIGQAISQAELGPSLFAASPALNLGPPRLLVVDAALRARELPVLIGPHAREFAEAWFAVSGGPAPVVMLADPTLLSLTELAPWGSRGKKAPLASAIDTARAVAEPIVVLIDDLDPASAGFWLPELARCQRNPRRYGFPDNLLFLAVVEADPAQMNLTVLRCGELFPLVFDDCDPSGAKPERPAKPFCLSSELVEPPAASTSWPSRVQAFEAALLKTFKPADARSLSADLAEFLQHQKGGGPAPKVEASLAALLIKSAQRLRGTGPEGN